MAPHPFQKTATALLGSCQPKTGFAMGFSVPPALQLGLSRGFDAARWVPVGTVGGGSGTLCRLLPRQRDHRAGSTLRALGVSVSRIGSEKEFFPISCILEMRKGEKREGKEKKKSRKKC